MPIDSDQDILIVGGGVIGLFSACALHEAGYRVTVVERGSLGQESSWAGGGILSPLYPWRYADEITRLASLSQKIYPEWLQNMQRVTGVDPQYLGNGMLILGDYGDEQPASWAQRRRIDMSPVDAAEIRQIAPEVSQTLQQGWWFPSIHQVRNPRLVSLLKAYLQTTSVRLHEKQQVKALDIKNNRVNAVQTGTTRFQAERIVIAGGAWSGELLGLAGLPVDIKPIRGQMLLLNGPADRVSRITLAEGRYIIPRKDGRVLVGSTTEDVGFDKHTTRSVRRELLDFAHRCIPLLADFELEHHWSGLRPGSPCGIPVIGRHGELDNLYINSGHYRNGLVLAPASALLLAEIMQQKATSLPASDYTPDSYQAGSD